MHGCVMCFVMQIKMKVHGDLLADVIQSHQELSVKHEQMLNVSLQPGLLVTADVFYCICCTLVCLCRLFIP